MPTRECRRMREAEASGDASSCCPRRWRRASSRCCSLKARGRRLRRAQRRSSYRRPRSTTSRWRTRTAPPRAYAERRLGEVRSGPACASMRAARSRCAQVFQSCAQRQRAQVVREDLRVPAAKAAQARRGRGRFAARAWGCGGSWKVAAAAADAAHDRQRVGATTEGLRKLDAYRGCGATDLNAPAAGAPRTSAPSASWGGSPKFCGEVHIPQHPLRIRRYIKLCCLSPRPCSLSPPRLNGASNSPTADAPTTPGAGRSQTRTLSRPWRLGQLQTEHVATARRDGALPPLQPAGHPSISVSSTMPIRSPTR